MKKILQIPARKIPLFRRYIILMKSGDKIHLSGNGFSLPGLTDSTGIEMVKVIHCKVGEKLQFSYSIGEKKKAIIESADNVEEIKSERK